MLLHTHTHRLTLCGPTAEARGVTVGECKLWAVLHTLKLIKPAVLDGFPKLAAFYARVGCEPWSGTAR